MVGNFYDSIKNLASVSGETGEFALNNEMLI